MPISVDMQVNRDQSIEIHIWDNEFKSGNIFTELQSFILTAFKNSGCKIKKIESTNYPDPGLNVRIDDVRLLQKVINFVDYHRSKSFFKEKYYFKLLLNSGMLESDLFIPLNKSRELAKEFDMIFNSNTIVDFEIKFPGKCTFTNMKKINGDYIFQVNYRDIKSRGTLITFESVRFIPSVSLTVLIILFFLIFLLARYILSKKKLYFN
ncbi:MAG: hypothetical protein P8Y60_08350 [Calditrichota bacterium]